MTRQISFWQKGTLLRAVGCVAGVGVFAFVLRDDLDRTVLLALGSLFFLVAFLFHGLGVEVHAEEIRMWFGPGLIKKRIQLAEVKACREVRNTWWMGWGIRYIGSGWLWNVSGMKAVELEFVNGQRFRIGTDEPRKISEAIQQALKARSSGNAEPAC